MPINPLIVSGGANAALEAHNQDLAKRWLDRAQGKMNDSPQVERERERYLTLKGDYAEAAKLGFAVSRNYPKIARAWSIWPTIFTISAVTMKRSLWPPSTSRSFPTTKILP
jgi:hypothetical protein